MAAVTGKQLKYSPAFTIYKSSVIIHYLISSLTVMYPYKQSHSDYLFCGPFEGWEALDWTNQLCLQTQFQKSCDIE